MEETRVETDEEGVVIVPAYSYYGIQTRRALSAYPSVNHRMQPEWVVAASQTKKAWIRLSVHSLKIPSRVGSLLIRSAEEIEQGRWHDQIKAFPTLDGTGTAYQNNLNEVLINRALELLGESKGDYALLDPVTYDALEQPDAMFLGISSVLAMLALMEKGQAACELAGVEPERFQQWIRRLEAVQIGRCPSELMKLLATDTDRKLQWNSSGSRMSEVIPELAGEIEGIIATKVQRSSGAEMPNRLLKQILGEVAGFRTTIAHLIEDGAETTGPMAAYCILEILDRISKTKEVVPR
ncbi:hypothetical protein [Cohnella fermenti]|uniref:Uncharacterized protein n=1 Tax=Cohnella fermenti TaxID=2565925 RepID=A0A4S4C4K8_9BACL|nr:hypothetical protein [Cohnella fermenti]THF82674.1 hypothetical protein E6C55_06300 [Cohnella fermenti]